jgi:hypothetical protein
MGSRHQLRRVPESPALLLADAEIAEDHVEQIFDIDGTGNPAEAARANRRSSARSSGTAGPVDNGWRGL